MGTRSLSAANVKLTATGTIKNTLTDGAEATVSQGKNYYEQRITNGVSVNNANRLWEDLNRSLSSSSSEVIDLYDFAGIDIGAGAGLDGLGQSMAIEEIVAIAILAESTSSEAGALEIEPDATNGWSPIGTHTVATGGAIKKNGCLFKCNPHEDGFDVTDASSHRIKITANGGDMVYSIIVFGRHDDDESSSSSSLSSSSSSSSSSSLSSSSSSSLSSSSSSSSSLSSSSSST